MKTDEQNGPTSARDDLVTVTREDGVTVVTLSAANRRNGIGSALAGQLRAAAEAARSDAGTRCVLLRADGPTFGVGGDLAEFTGVPAESRAGHLGGVIDDLHAAVTSFGEMDVPVVAAVHGNVAGASVSLLGIADLVVASDTATFGFAYTAAGLTPDGGASWTLPRVVGERRALELLVTNRRLGAAEALSWGLVSELTSADDLDRRARSLCRSLAAGPVQAFRGVKRLIRLGAASSLAESLDAERESLIASVTSPDGAEGMSAFLEKRPPRFR